MSAVMCLANLLATDPLFRTACKADPGSALAQHGIVLTDLEFQAFDRVRALLTRRSDNDGWPPVDGPDWIWC